MTIFSACTNSDKSKDYKTASLSSENYWRYLNIGLNFDNFDVFNYGTDSFGREKFRVFSAGQLTIQRIDNLHFDHATLRINLSIKKGWNMDFLFGIVGFVPAGIAIFWFYELCEEQRGFYYGFVGAVSLLFAGFFLVNGLKRLYAQGKSYLLIVAILLLILSITLYKVWKHKE